MLNNLNISDRSMGIYRLVIKKKKLWKSPIFKLLMISYDGYDDQKVNIGKLSTLQPFSNHAIKGPPQPVHSCRASRWQCKSPRRSGAASAAGNAAAQAPRAPADPRRKGRDTSCSVGCSTPLLS